MGDYKCRPILFSAPMVRAILEGRKTQTRRIMSFQPDGETRVHVEHFYQSRVNKKTGELEPGPEVFGAWWDDGECGLKCPYGAPGDRLWCRESFDIPDDLHESLDLRDVLYRADGGAPYSRGRGERFGWRPSIHMPRKLSRITLEVTGVRVERLQDISGTDALAEGVCRPEVADEWRSSEPFAQGRFQYLWESINGPGSWALNPWVWVVQFRRVEAAT